MSDGVAPIPVVHVTALEPRESTEAVTTFHTPPTQSSQCVRTPAPPDTAEYLALVRDRRLWLPNLAAMQTGLAYSFAFTFLPLLLIEAGVKLALFFMPFTAALLLVRFVGLKYLQRLPPAVAGCLGTVRLCERPLQSHRHWGERGLCPALRLAARLRLRRHHAELHQLSTSHYPQAERARPVALINTCFNVGSIAAVQITGAALNVIGWFGVPVILGTVIAGMFLILVVQVGRSRISRRFSVP